jgi:AcrR family transcriptional regulator
MEVKAKPPPDVFRDLEALKPASLSPRDRVLRTALELFYQHGVHTVGIDRIIAESGVAKMTFYRHFPSKADLVAEYLGYMDRAWQRILQGFIGDEARPPRERLLAIFDAVEVFTRNPSFRGCPFIKGLAEFGPERNEPEVKRRISRHFADMEKLITGLVKQMHPKDAKKYVQPLMSLIVGAVVIAHATGSTEVASRNKESARALLS